MAAHWTTRFFSGMALELWRRAIPPAATAAEAAFLWEALALAPGARVLDVPCGNGRLALELARRGARVTGVDIAAEFIAEARAAAKAQGLRATWRRGDLRRLAALLGQAAAGTFDGAFCFGNSFGYFDREETAAFLAAVAAALRPRGRFAIDTAMTAESVLPQLDERPWWPVGDMELLVAHDYVAAESRLDTEYTFVRGAERETRRASHWIYTVGELRHLLRQAGLTVREVWSDLERTPFAYNDRRLLLVAE